MPIRRNVRRTSSLILRSIEPVALGHHRLTFRAPNEIELVLELFDGGGFVASHGIWREADGPILAILEAQEA